MSRRERISRSTKRFKASRTDVDNVESLFPKPPHLGAMPTDREVPVTDIEEVPQPGPDHANPAEPDHSAIDPGPPAKAEVPRRERERQPIRPDWTHDPWGVISWEIGEALHRAGFHAIRSPGYAAKLAAWSPRGLIRAYEALYRFGRDVEALPLRAKHVDNGETGDFLELRSQASRRAAVAALVGAGVPAVDAVLLLDPGTRWPALAATVTGLGILGRPRDRPAIPSAVVGDPKYKKITPDMILRALQAAGLCTTKEDPSDVFEFQAPGVGRDGPGWAATIDLPYGKTADEAIKLRTKIAAGLRVDEFRLFIDPVRGDRGHAGQIRMWIADRDPFAQSPAPSPLLKMQRFDIFEPVPFGLNERGDLVKVLMMWTSFLIGSLPRMGKTYCSRLLAAAAALDPHVRHIIWDGKGGKDWSEFEQIAHEFGVGDDDDVVLALRNCLRRQVAEARRRFKIMRTLPPDVCPESKLTPGLHRNRELDMPVTLISIDEFHLYAEHSKYGAEIVQHLTYLAKTAPAAGFILNLSTQRPSSRIMETDFRDVIGTRFALRVTTWQFSEMILGAGAKVQGLDASRFLAIHKGIGILLGTDDGPLTDRGGQNVRTHLLDLDGTAKVLKRARDLREGTGTLTGVSAGEDPALSLRVLDHVVQAFRGDPQMHSDRLVRNMVEDHPGIYGVQDYDQNDLVSDMRRFGIKVGVQVWARKLETNSDTGEVYDGEMGNRRGFERQPIIDAITARTIVPDSPDDEE